uniref:Switch-associated protein 70 n=1 Tax=Cacopsylla melanoneura TaxID=428564 RepID=A0A8D8X710_9HEMI
MASLLNNVSNSIWHAFTSLGSDKPGYVLKSKLKVLTANIGTILDLYGVEKGLEHFRSTPDLNFHHFKYYLLKEVFSSIPDIHSFVELRAYEGKIDEICWLICKKHYLECLRGDQLPHLPDNCVYQLFRVFCLLADLIPESENGEVLQVVLHTSEVGLIASQIVNSLGSEWDQEAFDQITTNIPGFKFTTFITLLERRFLNQVDRAGLCEAVTAVAHTFIEDVIKKGILLKRGYLLPTLRDYWFVLKPTQLVYYKNQEEREQCGVIAIDGNSWIDSTLQRIIIHTKERTYEIATYDHRSRLQWITALKLAISHSGDRHGYQRMLAAKRRKLRELECQEKRRRSSVIHDMDIALKAEKEARKAAEQRAKELKQVQERQVEELEQKLEEETQAKRDEEIVRNLQARILREEWEKREELERLQSEQKTLLEQERRKREEFERKQKEKEAQLLEAQQRLQELEAERQRLDKELEFNRRTLQSDVQSKLNEASSQSQFKVRRSQSFVPLTKSRPSTISKTQN